MVPVITRQHVAQKFDEEMEDLRNHVLKMGGLVEQQIRRASNALRTLDAKEAEEVVQHDEYINALEVSIDERCAHILVRRQLAASDLRMIVAVIKTITDLERIGDEAERIAKMAISISEKDSVFHNRYIGITHLSEHVISMVHKALDAFARLDTDEAFDVVRDDEKADAEYQSTMRQMLTYMMEDPRTITESLDMMQAARALERIGDHAMNIGEYIIYLVLGKDIRHLPIQDLERDIVS
ncbi:MAG: phosphate signaling complex protein PhoU [Gammaproteobacteria bacterium]|nr:phosphate signaling complex protein PhoU [Gammaproteobacteria bacterium]